MPTVNIPHHIALAGVSPFRTSVPPLFQLLPVNEACTCKIPFNAPRIEDIADIRW